MALTAQLLFDSIQIPGSLFFGAGDAEIFDVIWWEKGQADHSLPDGTLFVMEDGAEGFYEKGGSWICVPPDWCGEAVARVRELLIRDYRRKSVLSRLYQVLPNSTEQEMIHICARIMGNPVQLLDGDFGILACSEDEIMTSDPVRLRNAVIHSGGRSALLEPDDSCSCRRILCGISCQGRVVGYLLTFELQCPLVEGIDRLCMERLCEALSGWMRLESPAGRADAIEVFVMELLRGQLTDETAIHQRQRVLGWPHSEKYYVLSVDVGSESGLDMVRREMTAILHREIYTMGRHCLAVLGCKIADNLSYLDFPELLNFLSEHDLYAGLSNGFLDLVTIRQAFEQSVIVIPLRQRFSMDIRLARYEDLILIHLADTASKNGVPLQSLCHPLVVNVSNYDLEHGTDYLKTLSAYVLNNMSIQQSADVLFIHRNTMHYRVNVLKEQFHIDFSNARLFMKLRISVTIYSYLGNVKLIDLWGPLI